MKPKTLGKRLCANQYRYHLTALALLALLYGYSFLSAGNRLSATPFRESQTAITSYYMALGESPFWTYEVPVLGSPWSLPLEFPLYQWLTAILGGNDQDTLRWTGRSLSLAFFGGCIVLTWMITGRLPLTTDDRIAALLLLASAPVFTLYSCAFLIESFALFWALAYILAYQRLRESPKWPQLIWTCGLGVLASLSKPTTWAPFAGVILLQTLTACFVRRKRTASDKLSTLSTAQSVTSVVLPLLAALIWIDFSDTVKTENPLTRGLTSAGLSTWNYGTLDQKLSPAVWAVILGKQGLLLFGIATILVPIVIPAAFWGACRKRVPPEVTASLSMALAGYLSAPAIFTNLHYRHDYYLFANGPFLIAAFVLGVAAIREFTGTKACRLAYMVTCISAITAAFIYTGIRKSLIDPQEDAAIAAIKDINTPGGIVCFGFDWSARLPYETGRRALMLTNNDPTSEKYLEATELNRDNQWAAIVASGPSYSAIINDIKSRMRLDYPHFTEVIPGVQIHSKMPTQVNRSNTIKLILDRVKRKLPANAPATSGIVFSHNFLLPNACGDGLFELIYKRNNDLFYLMSRGPKIYRLRNYFSQPPITDQRSSHNP